MSFSLSSPIIRNTKHVVITQIGIDYVSKKLFARYEERDGEAVVYVGEMVISDSQELKDFSDFYNSWTSHEQIYDILKESLNLSGSYEAEDGIA